MSSPLAERRKQSGMSQYALAQKARIPRMRLSLAETGHLTLTEAEELAIRQALSDYIEQRVNRLRHVQERVTT